MRALCALLLPAILLAAACSEPPQKELDRAQGAIDAARAAGAEQYAPEAFAAATTALSEAHEAVAQRDYRLALTRALDAGDRAQDAAKGAADGKARARSEAEAATNAAAATLARLQARINADRGRTPKRDLAAGRRTQHDAELTLQKTRAAIGAGDFLVAKETVKGLNARIGAQIQALDTAASARPSKPPRRRR